MEYYIYFHLIDMKRLLLLSFLFLGFKIGWAQVTISAEAIDYFAGKSIVFANVSVNGEHVVLTDMDGEFKLNNLSCGTHIIEITHSDFSTVVDAIEIDSGQYKVQYYLLANAHKGSSDTLSYAKKDVFHRITTRPSSYYFGGIERKAILDNIQIQSCCANNYYPYQLLEGSISGPLAKKMTRKMKRKLRKEQKAKN
jgi:hypothetical protein